MKTALQECTIIFETNHLKMIGDDGEQPEFTLENMRNLINNARVGEIELECTTNYWQNEPKPVILIKLK